MMKEKKRLRTFIERARGYPLINMLCGSAFALILLSQGLALFFLRGESETLVLHFTKSGIDQFGSFWQLQGYGLIGLVVVIMNYFIAIELEERDWFWGKFVAGVTLGLAILLFVAFRAIISVN